MTKKSSGSKTTALTTYLSQASKLAKAVSVASQKELLLKDAIDDQDSFRMSAAFLQMQMALEEMACLVAAIRSGLIDELGKLESRLGDDSVEVD